MLLVVKIASLKHRPSGAHLLPFLWISLSRILFSIPMFFVLLVLLVTRGVEFFTTFSPYRVAVRDTLTTHTGPAEATPPEIWLFFRQTTCEWMLSRYLTSPRQRAAKHGCPVCDGGKLPLEVNAWMGTNCNTNANVF